MPPRSRDLLAVVIMTLGVVAVYLPPRVDRGATVLAMDYHQLHERRMNFARGALLGPAHGLPTWYPRELLGTPFRANIQNFPFIPTRLLVLLALDPSGTYTYSIAVMLSAALAALFTFLYCRRIGLGALASVVGGWTFACCGYYAARVAAGHLPLLEGFLALPLILWTIESSMQSLNRRRWLLAIGASSACLALAGHPQLPAYSMVAGAAYAFWRGGISKGWRAILAMALGVGCAAFALIPMSMLIGRSTRVLPLAASENDIALPYSMLQNFFRPFLHGFPPPMSQARENMFGGFPNFAYFWDTFCYVGWAPWAALLVLVAMRRRGGLSRRVVLFILTLGVLGMLLALPYVRSLSAMISSGTILRSPARLLYFTEFALAIALSGAIQCVLNTAPKEGVRFLLFGAIAAHVIDLSWHDRAFIQLDSSASSEETAAAKLAADSAGDGRVAFDYAIPVAQNRTVDDVGVFDSILLARPYHFLLDLTGADPDLNIQFLDGSRLSPRALAAACVRTVVSLHDCDGLAFVGQVNRLKLYRVKDPAPRAAFFTNERVRFAGRDAIRAALRDSDTDISRPLLLPEDSPRPLTGQGAGDATVEYTRPTSDRIECSIRTPSPGYLRVIEAFDPGWTATVDGIPTSIVPAWEALLAVPVPAGEHRAVFVYQTPGAGAGIAVGGCSLVGLIALVWFRGNAKAGARSVLG